ncbi:type II secretion system protein F [Aeromicrobium phragmitis]|uniref:Type II secretion system protein F n=1 Tax=Aeromicrobium phragmitis TaxID=2478914 RepID=A0A3L8PNB3_9ACTN|nr:type II secretion system F family protein [Aeromicrobium phragmitis]RLV56674.1 type II secretion system protein F [Aeromicrobium phragmitis]
MLALGTVLLGAALAVLAVAFRLTPGGAVPRDRLQRYGLRARSGVVTKVSHTLVDQVDSHVVQRGWRPFSAEELRLAGISLSVAQLIVAVGAATLALGALGLVFSGPVAGAFLALATPVLVKVLVSARVARQRRRFADQLPAALQMMAASLRAGHSFARSLDVVARESEEPMSTEMARAVNEHRLGRDLVEALDDIAVRMDYPDFAWVAGAVGSQRETGGNLNEILDQVAETIRERAHLRQHVRSLSAEGRLSALILMVLPLLLGAYYLVASPDLMQAFTATLIGKLLLLLSAIGYAAGGLWMRSVVKVEF